MLLGKIEIVFAEGFGLQAGVDITLNKNQHIQSLQEIYADFSKK